jgi:uncharacterized protein (TIGR02594 family)
VIEHAIKVTPYDIAHRYIGLHELEGKDQDHPLIQWWLSMCSLGYDSPDETPWCSAFLQHPFYELGLPRSRSAAARSWLTVGRPVNLTIAARGFDVVVLKRGPGPQPGPEVLAAPGHAGLFSGIQGSHVLVLAGNQGNGVSIAPFPIGQILGIRRILGVA